MNTDNDSKVTVLLVNTHPHVPTPPDIMHLLVHADTHIVLSTVYGSILVVVHGWA